MAVAAPNFGASDVGETLAAGGGDDDLASEAAPGLSDAGVEQQVPAGVDAQQLGDRTITAQPRRPALAVGRVRPDQASFLLIAAAIVVGVEVPALCAGGRFHGRSSLCS